MVVEIAGAAGDGDGCSFSVEGSSPSCLSPIINTFSSSSSSFPVKNPIMRSNSVSSAFHALPVGPTKTPVSLPSNRLCESHTPFSSSPLPRLRLYLADNLESNVRARCNVCTRTPALARLPASAHVTLLHNFIACIFCNCTPCDTTGAALFLVDPLSHRLIPSCFRLLRFSLFVFPPQFFVSLVIKSDFFFRFILPRYFPPLLLLLSFFNRSRFSLLATACSSRFYSRLLRHV